MAPALPGLAATPALTWSVTDHGSHIRVDGATALRSSSAGDLWQSARSDRSQSKGVRTVTFRIVETGGGAHSIRVGLANGVARMRNYVGTDRNGVSYGANGYVITARAPIPPRLQPFGTGDAVGMVADLDAKTVRFNRNGGSYGAPIDISGLGPEIFVAVSLLAGSGPAAPAVRIETSDWIDLREGTLNIVAHGDSMTLAGGVRKIWVQRLAEMLEENGSGPVSWTKVGINGASWDFAWSRAGYAHTLTQDAPIRVDPLRGSSLPTWLVVFAGTNGLAMARHDAAHEYAALQRYLRDRIAAGWAPERIVVCTMLPRTDVQEAVRRAYNAAIVADRGAIGYSTARLDLDPRIGAAGRDADSEWYLDGIHPTDAGHAVIAQVVYRAIAAGKAP